MQDSWLIGVIILGPEETEPLSCGLDQIWFEEERSNWFRTLDVSYLRYHGSDLTSTFYSTVVVFQVT